MMDIKQGGGNDSLGLKAAGAMLRKARMQQGLTVEEIAQATRIQKSHLYAIEKGDGSSLPSGPFAKGFVISYGRHLGVPAKELEAALERPAVEVQRAPAPASPLDPDTDPPAQAPTHRRKLMPIVALAGVVVIAVGIGLFLRGDQPPVVEPAQADALAAHPVEDGGPQAESERIVRAASVEGEDGQSYYVFSDLEREEGPHTISVKARYRSYVHVSTELGGEPVYEAVMEPGDNKTFSSESELWLVLGNAGGVDVSYDGQALAELGLDGDRHGFAFRGP